MQLIQEWSLSFNPKTPPPWPFVEGSRRVLIDMNSGWKFTTIKNNPVGVAEKVDKHG